MSTSPLRMARWATDLSLDDLPPRVRERAALQHLGAAGIVRALTDAPPAAALFKAAGGRGAGPVIGGRQAPRRDAVRLHLALAGWLGWSDSVLLGQPVLGGAVAAWAYAKGHTVGDVLRATVAANEVAGRMGAATLLGPGAGLDGTWALTAGATTAIGLLDGLDADGLARALSIALSQAPAPSRRVGLADGAARAAAWGQAGAVADDAVTLAKAGLDAPLDLLDDRDGPLAAACWVPLRHAFTGLGQAWFTGALAFRNDPLHVFAQVPVQAVMEILQRHIKAADKRLRADQVDRVEVFTGAPGWLLAKHMDALPGLTADRVVASIRRGIGWAVAGHDLSTAALTPAALAPLADRITHVARRVEVRHDYTRTAAMADHAVEVVAPLLSGLTRAELAHVGARARAFHGHRLPAPGPMQLLQLVQQRPDRLLERLRYAPHDLAQSRLDQWQDQLGVEVRVHTTRGGSWPERRLLPEGSPGWPWQDTADRVRARFAQGDPERADAAVTLQSTPSGDEAEGWVEALLA